MGYREILFLLCFLPAMTAGAASPLAGHYSPYLALHADDPVQWQLWGDGVIQQARRENKLIFISSGYFACHWCHVMQQESFHNDTVAALLNRFTIPVKVDRELNPELDAALIEFVERTRGAAGWPLNVFLTPEGYPLVGTVYLPPEDFIQLIERLEQRWRAEGELLARLAREAAQQGTIRNPANSDLDMAQFRDKLRNKMAEAIERQGDFLGGGLGDGAKFPNAPLMETLLPAAAYDGSLKAFSIQTLEQMAGQGLRDHLGGGFFRYTVDPNWQQPHFEKMLYDNALLARLYLHAGKVLKRPVWRDVALETMNFMLSRMWHKEGAFISSLSAVDEAGVEGGYYLWTQEQLQYVLDKQAYQLINLAWSFHSAEEWQDRTLPIPSDSEASVAKSIGLPLAKVRKQLEVARQTLVRVREQRTLPRDEKRIAGWNGLALSALSEVIAVDERYRQAGQVVRDYLHSLWSGDRLWRVEGQSGALEDYIYVAQGLLDWADASGDGPSRKLAKRLVESAWQRFHDDGGWYRGEGEAVRALSPATPMLTDGALPSPSALWIRLSRRLASKEQQQHEALLVAPEVLLANPLLYPSYLSELERAVKSDGCY